MCKEVLTFRPVTTASPEKDEIGEIYNEAFPEQERPYPFETLLRCAGDGSGLRVAAAYDGEKLVGFIAYVEREAYHYLLYFAVKNTLRGQGYGTKLVTMLLKSFKGKFSVGCIETPIPGTGNYEQREKRRRFYERLGMFMTKYSCGDDAENMLTFLSDRPEKVNEEIIADILVAFRKCMPDLAPEGMKLFVTENGAARQITLNCALD